MPRRRKWKVLLPNVKKRKVRKEWDFLIQQEEEGVALNVFENIYIAKDGGFSEVKELWYSARWATALLTVSFLISNVYFIITTDLAIINGMSAGDSEDCEVAKAHAKAHGVNTTRNCTQDMFLLTQPVARFVGVGRTQGDDFIAVLELIGLTLLLSRLAHQLMRVWLRNEELVRWVAMERVFWQIIPMLTAYSAMRLLHYITPTVILAAVSKHLAETRSLEQDYGRIILIWAKFLLRSVVCFFVGFDAFLVKIRTIYDTINSSTFDMRTLVGALVFMIQVLGIVQLGMFVKERLFTFIFAGEDAIMNPYEKAKKNVWNAMLARHMWNNYDWKRFIVLMLSFDDADFQKLVLNEKQVGDDPDLECDIRELEAFEDAPRITLTERSAMLAESSSESDSDTDSDDEKCCVGRSARA